MRRRSVLSLLAALAASACAHREFVGPAAGGDTAAPAEAAWWQVFEDPALDQAMVRVTQANPDVRLAVAKVREARAVLGIAQGLAGPTVAADTQYGRLRYSERTLFEPAPDTPNPVSYYSAQFTFRWEIDLFGRLANERAAAQAGMQAAALEAEAVRQLILGQVGAAYVDLHWAVRRETLGAQRVQAARERLVLMERRFNVGVATGREFADAGEQWAGAEAAHAEARRALRAARTAWTVLHDAEPLTQAPDRVVGDDAFMLPAPPASPLPLLPPVVVLKRPDVAALAQRAAAATARVEVARADRFPRLVLDASAGAQALLAVPTAGAASPAFWQVIPGLALPLLDPQRGNDRVKAEQAREEQAAIEYRKAVLTALKEIDDATGALFAQQTRCNAMRHALQEAAREMQRVQAQFDRGLLDRPTLLEVRKRLLELYEKEADERAGYWRAYVDLMRAIAST